MIPSLQELNVKETFLHADCVEKLHFWGYIASLISYRGRSQNFQSLNLLHLLEHLQLHNGYIWWPYAFLSNSPLVDPLITPSSHMAFLNHFTLVDRSWPLQDLWPINALHSGLGSFLPNLVATGHFKEFDLWLFLSNLTSSWPQVTSAWPLTPAMHYALDRASHQIWLP